MLDSLLLLLVICPVDLSSLVPVAAFPDTLAALRRVAEALDLSAAGDSTLWEADKFRREVVWTRARWRELCHCPPSSDAIRLPPLDLCANHLSWALQRHRELEADRMSRLHLWTELGRQLDDQRQRRDVWQAILAAHGTGCTLASRRQALCDLRRLIGDARYHAGDWPAPVRLHAAD